MAIVSMLIVAITGSSL